MTQDHRDKLEVLLISANPDLHTHEIDDLVERIIALGGGLSEADEKLEKITALYKKRCEETVHDFSFDEEMFLADISMVIYGEDGPDENFD